MRRLGFIAKYKDTDLAGVKAQLERLQAKIHTHLPSHPLDAPMHRPTD